MTDLAKYAIPCEVLELARKPILKGRFLDYVKNRIWTEELSVLDCTVLLAGLDIVGRSIMDEFEMGKHKGYPAYGDRLAITGRRHLGFCDYLADALRAKRRRVVVCEMQRFLWDKASPRRFVESVVIPMLSRRWLPAMCYEPAIGVQRSEVEAWQGSGVHGFEEDMSELLQYRDPHREKLEGAIQGVADSRDSVLYIIAALRSWEWSDAPSWETASYLAAALLVYEQCQRPRRRELLEVPILLRRQNQSVWEPGHILRALVVPFEVQCTQQLTEESLVPAARAVQGCFVGCHSPPAAGCSVAVGDYPGGVYCPGNAMCATANNAQRTSCGYRHSWFRGPSASPALGALLAADALGLEIRSHRYTTAKLASSGRIDALSDDQSDDDDSYLQAKGLTMSLLAHASGQQDVRVVVNSQDIASLSKGAERYIEESDPGSQGNRTSTKPAWAVSWQAVSSLRDALDYFLSAEIEGCIWPGIYQDLIANLALGKDRRSVLAAAAAHRILTDVDVDRWIVSLPAQTHGVEGTGGFEMDLAREIYRLSTSLGMVRVPVRVSVARLFEEYAGRHSIAIDRPQGLLGKTVARLGCISLPEESIEQHQVWAYQVERDLHEGRLILMLGGLPRDDSSDSICYRMSMLIESLRSQRDSESQWNVRDIVAVTHATVRDSQRTARQVFEDYGFREIKLEDDAIPEQVLH